MDNFQNLSNEPLKLMKNRVWRPFVGGKMLDRWQDITPALDGHKPEEWVASLTETRNMNPVENEGLSMVELADGSVVSLKDIIEAAPGSFLGPEHVRNYGNNLAVLTKVLDSYSRLMIQVHPDKEFARKELNSPFGKTEAWYILGGRVINGEEPYVLLGFKPGITKEYWKKLYEEQDVAGMIEALHKISVKEGDAFLIEGGVPHAMGSGVFFMEIMEPTDFTMRVERKSPDGVELPDSQLHQGVGFNKMFDCFDYQGMTEEEVMENWYLKPEIIRKDKSGEILSIVSPMRSSYFSMKKVVVNSKLSISNSSFAIAVAISGSGKLRWDTGEMEIRESTEIFLPYQLGDLELKSDGEERLELIFCYPPDTKYE